MRLCTLHCTQTQDSFTARKPGQQVRLAQGLLGKSHLSREVNELRKLDAVALITL